MNVGINLVDESLVAGNSASATHVEYPRDFDSDEQLREFYIEFGYASIKGVIPSDLLERICEDLIQIFEPYSTDSSNPVDSAIIRLDRENKKKLYELHVASCKLVSFSAINDFFSNLVKRISGRRDPVLEIGSGFLLSIPRDERLVYDFHQESTYMRGFEDIFNVHYPLFRTSNVENGTMSLIPGTHRFGTLSYEKSRKSEDSYTNLVPKNIESIVSTTREIHCYLELGDVTIFHKDLIHRSNFNRSKLCRPVGVSRFTQSLVGDWVNRKPEEL